MINKLLIYVFLGYLITAVVPVSAQKNQVAVAFDATKCSKNLTDEQLLDLVQKQTIRYFCDFAHPVSGLARERSNVAFNYGNEVVTTNGTGFGAMALIVGVDRGWLQSDTVVRHLLKMVNEYGFGDAFNETQNWYAKSHLAIDQGPIVVMIENYRSG
jgi:hypothetical protein